MNNITIKKPKNRWANDRIQPGPVGSVGDVNPTVRLKHSTPDLPIRWANWTYGQNAPFLGANVQDGQWASFENHGAPARVNDTVWGARTGFRTSVGWRIEDITKPDTLVEPFVSCLGDYSWRNKIATTYEAKRTGALFLPLPGEYTLSPGEISRGGSQVRVTEITPGDLQPLTEPLFTSAQREAGSFGSVPGRAGISQQGLQFGGVNGGMPGLGNAKRTGFSK